MKNKIVGLEFSIEKNAIHSLSSSTAISAQPAPHQPVPSRSCAIVGSGTLAVYCARQLMAAGHIIQVVLFTDAVLQTWALDEGIHCVDSIERLNTYVEQHPVDWLFSVVNPLILPSSLIEKIREGAFNYHDAPLPRYAGHYATSWALLAHESDYAITWHRLAAAVDAGHIAVQHPVVIDANETALTLNLKCYQAAREGFNELLSHLGQCSLTVRPQDLTHRSFYAKHRRPPAGAYLRWTSSARDLSALARALTFGELYPNPLGCLKLWLQQGTVQVARVERLDQRSGAAAGTVIRITPHAWQIATGSEDVLISGFATLEGEPLSAQTLAVQSGLAQGTKLPELTQQQSDAVTKIHKTLAPHELFWQQRLARWQFWTLPFEHGERDTEPNWATSAWCPPLQEKSEANQPVMTLLTVLAIYLARLTEQRQFQIGWRVNDADDPLKALACLAPVVPIDITVELDQPFARNLAHIDAEYARVQHHHTFVRDLIARCPALRSLPDLRTTHPWSVAVSVLPDQTQPDLVAYGEAVGALLTLQIDTRGAFRWLYDAKRLDADQVQRISEHLRELGHASLMAEGAEVPAGKLNLLPAAERELLLSTWNATERDYPAHLCIHQLFEAQVARTPDAIALVDKAQTLSYAQLNAQANGLAHRLVEWGVQPGDYVATLLERSIELVVAQLAILKAGAVYVPIDPRAPAERQVWVVTDCMARLVLTDTHIEVPDTLPTAVLYLSQTDVNGIADIPASDLQQSVRTSLDTAYMMYTSGSTGTPKGVLVPHHAIARLTINNGYVDIGGADRVAFSANPAFDASTFEVWAPLLNGGGVAIFDSDTVLNPSRFEEALTRYQVTTLFLTTALFNQLVPVMAPALSRLKYLLCGGEQENLDSFKQLLRQSGPTHLIHCYGPTESTTFSTTYEVTELSDRSERLPIGRPIANTRVYLLDAHGQPVPLGAVGELYIGGAGVARGYWNRPELSAERFMPDPFSDCADARMYKTGDLARYLPDGNLEYLRRNDEQVKIRGFRIEPGEIAARLAGHSQVREAVVLATGAGADKRLVAYVVAEPDEQLASTLRAHVAAALPEYMVPAAFMRLDAFPLTPNGKLDRRALPAPDDEALAHQAYEAPQGKLETTLATIWAELLGVARVGRHDSFFALGGHSLLAVQLIERLRRQDLSLSVRALFETPILSELARSLGQHREVAVPPNLITSDTTTLTPQLLPLANLNQADIDRIVEQVPGGVANIQDIYALSPMQDGILFHHLLSTKGDPYLLIVQMAFDDRALLDRYLNAVQQVVNRHDILRTAFFWEGLSKPVQVVWRHALLSITEIAVDPAAGQVTEQLAQRFDPRHHCLNLTQAPLLRFVITQNGDGRWLLVQLLHHLIHDHSTLEVMQAEVQAFIEGRGETLPPAQPFRNLVAQAYLGVSQVEHERFFTEMLADLEEPTLPFGLADVHHDGTRITEVRQRLPQALNDRLRAQAKWLNVSLASLCHLAWAQVLARASGQQRVVFGTVLFGRMHAGDGADSAMGLFVNTLPLRVDLDGSVQASVRATHARLAALLEHEHASLALAQRCSSVPAGTPLFSALLNYRHNAIQTVESETVSGIESLSFEERTNYPLILSVDDFGTALGLTTQIAQPFDPARVCGYMQQALEGLAEALEYTPDMPVWQLEILSSEERKRLLETWNATTEPYPQHTCIHQVFEAQAERTPQATALVYEQQTLSYAQLNAQANHLAHRLIELGVRPDTRVAICMERSPAMVVGLLAILKAGGAYVPLDPVYPFERLAYCLTDAAPAILLADAAGRAALGGTVLDSLTVLDPAVLPETTSINPNVPELTAHHLAYVIYTSGSTGTPKGVMVEHAQIVRLFETTPLTSLQKGDQVPNRSQRAYSLTPDDRVLQKTSFSFDVSLWEIFWTLMNGATLVVAAPDAHKDPFALMDLIIRQRITTVHFVPSMLRTFLHSGSIQHCTSLKHLICSGEALSGASVRLCQTLLPQVQLHNLYGPTETSIGTTVWTCPAECTEENVSIGRPIANTRLYLLDVHGQPVPQGAVGELYIGGTGVTRGYLNRPELTAERFVPDPFSDASDARMYKSGDLARYRPDGNIEYLGRNDYQVKIRGFRIEPGEIEAHLIKHPQVRDALVLALGEDNDKRLIAYVIAAEPDEQLASMLRAHVAAALPEYMVPAAFVRLDAFPVTPNGKLDRRALPAPEGDAFARQMYEAPQGEIEDALATIWAELLGVKHISRHDSFFALGGHSLLAVQMIERIRATLGAEITILSLFEAPTVAALAQRLLPRECIQDDAFAILLPIQPNGTRPPLFCVHPVSGLSWLYRNLVNHLDTDQPVYGLQARGLNGVPPLADTIDAMASDYIKQIRRIQPDGPYHLLGWSFGGNVAHSMAAQLEQQGEKVALLALLDSYPDYAQRADDPEMIQKEFYIKLLARYGDESIPNVGEYLWEKTRDVIKNNHRLLKEDAPPIYCGDVLFFYATMAEDEATPLASPNLWRPYVLKNIETYHIHCKHRDMGGPGPAIEIGRILAQRLDELQQRQLA